MVKISDQHPNTKHEPRTRYSIFCHLASFLLITLAFAQNGGIPGGFLNYGMSPRTIAMGKAFTGLADDQEAIYYNPAGLVQLMGHNIKASYLSLYGAQLNYLGYGLPTKNFGSLSLSLINLTSNDVISRDTLGNEFPGFGFTQNCFIFTYAYQPLRMIGLGANLKLVTSKITRYGAVGMGGDLGLLLFPRGDLTFGMTIQNLLGPKLTHYQESEEFPVTMRWGGALKLYEGRTIIVFDLVKSLLDYSSLEPHLGIEFVPVVPSLTVRGGVDRNSLNFGIGLKNEWNKLTFGIDYSVELHYGSSYLLPPRHKLGIFIDFGGFRTWVEAKPKQFSPTPGQKENIAWLDVHYNTKRPIKRWQLLIKNGFGEVVRTYAGWGPPPLRLTWDGLDDIGRVVADGKYYYEIIIIDEIGETIGFSDLLTRVVTLGPEGEIEFIPQE
jgi:hypothetical protein